MIKILFLAANPSDTPRLRLDEEIRVIEEKIRLSAFRDNFELQQGWALSIADLQACFLRHKPHIIHFSGHSSSSSELLLNDNSGLSRPVPVRALSRLFAILRDEIRCVVLNSCYSRRQALSIARHIDCVIGMSTAITDTAAISFASSFYQALGYSRSIKTAFELGCQILDIEGAGAATPRLFAFNADPSEIVLAHPSGLSLSTKTSALMRDLTGGDDATRLETAQELAATSHHSLEILLIEYAAEDPHPSVRYWLNRALGKIGSTRAKAALRRNLADPHPYASMGAQDALRELGERSGV